MNAADRGARVSGTIYDPIGERIFRGHVEFENGVITALIEDPAVRSSSAILPGLVDSHIHVESSLCIPSQFARLAVRNGVVASISDPHEIANVCGVAGVRFMIEDGRRTPFKFYFGAPSCVPATSFESAGAVLGLKEVEELLDLPEVRYLAEMMNWPGVLNRDPLVMDKIRAAHLRGKPVDGHAPGLVGAQAERYASVGIDTDHECFGLEEALDKIRFGMKILIREGSAAKNFEALSPLLFTNPEKVMFCTDDGHPDYLLDGQINRHVARAVSAGADPLAVIRSASVLPGRHYGLETGFLQVGHPADLIVADSLTAMNVLETYIDGVLVCKDGNPQFHPATPAPLNNFHCEKIASNELAIAAKGSKIRAIGIIPGQLVSESLTVDASIRCGFAVADSERDLAKLVVKNRYAQTPVALGFVSGFGMQRGAIASSVGHDSHNIVAIGLDDEEIAQAVNTVVEHRGGLALVSGETSEILPLPFAGLMSGDDAFVVAKRYAELDLLSKSLLGSTLPAPFMTLSFLALLVIPKLKLSDRGLFDGERFHFTDIFVDERSR